MVDTSAIHKAIASARRRMKLQAALETLTLASVPLSVIALITVLTARLGVSSEETAISLLIGCASLLFVAAIVGFIRPYSKNRVATLLDRQAGLADRLATACAFEHTLANRASSATEIDGETESMMRLAIADAVRRVAKADPKGATPFRRPQHGKAAILFAVLALAASGIRIETNPDLTALTPDSGHHGDVISVSGHRLLSPSGQLDTTVILGSGDAAMIATTELVRGEHVKFVVPENAPVGPTTITLRVGSRKTNALPFVVLAEDEPGPNDSPDKENLDLEEEDIDYLKDLVSDLHKTAEANEDLQLEELAKELEKLVKDLEDGKVTKKELLETLAKAEEKYMEGSEEAVEETVSDLKKAGKELKKDKLTKELGKALEKGDLDKAKKEMEKLAQKLDDNKLSEKEQQKLGKAMEKAAQKMDKAEKKREKSMDKRLAKKQESIRKLEEKQQKEKDENKRKETARRLEREKRELKRLKRDKEERKKDPAKRELKQLRRKMSEAAKELQKKNKPNQQKSRRQVSKSMRDMARSTQKVSQDKRKMANKQKVTSQMSDLKEAMRRAKRKGKRGAKNRFGRNKRKRDFGSRARGGKGQKGAWKPGQGQGKGKGQGKQGKGQGKGKGGQKPGGDDYGDSHDENYMGDRTKMAGNAVDESLQGVRGKGPSTRETILTAAQKGFASRSYKKVFTNYKRIVEESIRQEKVPPGYKYYVKRYFAKIKPK